MPVLTQHRDTTRYRMIDEVGVRFGIAVGAEVLVLLVAGLVGAGMAVTVVAVVIAAGVTGRRLHPWAVLALGLVAWAFVTGFVENEFGLLTFAEGDLERLGLVVAATSLLARAVRRVGTAD